MKPFHLWCPGLIVAVFGLWLFGEVVVLFTFHLLSGWYFFLCRVVPSIRLNPTAIILCVTSFAGLVFGFRWLAGLIYVARSSEKDSTTSAGLESGTKDERKSQLESTEIANSNRVYGAFSLKQSLVAAGLVVTWCAVSIAGTGMVHAAYWLMTANPPDMKIEVPFRGYVQTRSNLTKIGLALISYHDANGSLPTGGTFLPDGTQGHSWMTRLAPYVDHAGLTEYIHAAEPWYSEHNAPAFRGQVPTYKYPSRYPAVTSDGFPATCFAANQYVMGANTSCSLNQIHDGTSMTLAVGEVKENPLSWGDPRNYRDPFLGINRSPHGFGGNRPQGESAIFLFCDGSVRSISSKIDPQVLGALGTPNGHEAHLISNDMPRRQRWARLSCE